MDLERIGRLQWCLIGLAVGVLLAVSRSLFGGDYDGTSVDQNFNRMAYGTAEAPAGIGFFFGPKQWVYFSDVVIHPPVPSEGKSEPAGTPIYWVTGKLHEMKYSNAGGKWRFEEAAVRPFFHRGATPYKSNSATYATVMAYLDHVAKDKPAAGRYRFAWWEKPSVIWSLYPAAGVLVIGGVWPSVLQLLAKMGLGRKRVEEASVNLATYKSTAEPAAQPKDTLTAEDLRQLDALTAAMEAGVGTGGNAPTLGELPRRQEDVRELETTPLEPVRTEGPQEAKAFDGDFYPTEIHRPGEKS